MVKAKWRTSDAAAAMRTAPRLWTRSDPPAHVTASSAESLFHRLDARFRSGLGKARRHGRWRFGVLGGIVAKEKGAPTFEAGLVVWVFFEDFDFEADVAGSALFDDQTDIAAVMVLP